MYCPILFAEIACPKILGKITKWDLSTFCYTTLKTSILDKVVHHQKCVNARLPSWPIFYKVHKRHFFVTLIYRSKLIFLENIKLSGAKSYLDIGLVCCLAPSHLTRGIKQ